MNKSHVYGIVLEEDIENLYGENHIDLNKIRTRIFRSYNPSCVVLLQLNVIIQNPAPITPSQFEEWIKKKNQLMIKYKKYISFHDKSVLQEMETFAKKYHVKDF